MRTRIRPPCFRVNEDVLVTKIKQEKSAGLKFLKQMWKISFFFLRIQRWTDSPCVLHPYWRKIKHTKINKLWKIGIFNNTPQYLSYQCIGQALQFLLNPNIVFISSSVNSKSNTWIVKKWMLVKKKEEKSRQKRFFFFTWKFSWMRWGVMDLGITMTFLWMWKRINTWKQNEGYQTLFHQLH